MPRSVGIWGSTEGQRIVSGWTSSRNCRGSVAPNCSRLRIRLLRFPVPIRMCETVGCAAGKLIAASGRGLAVFVYCNMTFVGVDFPSFVSERIT